MVVLSGLPGSGKSWFARRLAERIGASVVETDRVRRELFPVRKYSETEHRAVRHEAHRRLDALLAAGRTVIYDATNLHEVTRQSLYQLAAVHDCGLAIVQFVLPDAAIRENLDRRAAGLDTDDASEAGIAVYEQLRTGLQRVRRRHWRCTSRSESEQITEEIAGALAANGDAPVSGPSGDERERPGSPASHPIGSDRVT